VGQISSRKVLAGQKLALERFGGPKKNILEGDLLAEMKEITWQV
jgi:hypothetical protein